jgi:polar amino acid transport system substrate-binding protein
MRPVVLIRGVLFVLGTMLVLFGAGPVSSVQASPAEEVLRVGTTGTYPPFTFKKDGELQGIEIDFARALATELGRKLELVEVALPDLIGGANAGRIDVIMSGVSITKERAERIAFTKPYLQVGQMMLVRDKDVLRFRDRESIDADGVRIGVERATTGSKFAHRELRKAEILEFANKDDGLSALRAGNVDVFLHDAPFVWLVTGSPQNPNEQLSGVYTPLTDEHLAWAVRKGDTQLLARLDEIVAEWKQNGKIERILDTWIKVRKISIPLPKQLVPNPQP